MEPSIYAFIRKYSWRQQLIVLGFALALLPLNYATLELPKTIVNRALSDSGTPEFFGASFDRLDLLWLLCGLFLAAVILSGALKYVVNVYAGVIAERMLRRLRYQLYNHVLRFPLPHFRRVSQGELVQMINAETEALGGFVGEAVSTPAVQGGVLLTSLAFIFIQDPILGLAAIALYPIQIYFIPKLQAQVNQLGKQRVQQVRRNAERISESVGGIRDIHANAGARYEQARFSEQLGQVFWIRFAIYKKKFLIKFLNNFIAQLGPFFFFAIGGYLVLEGSISLGALVAVVSAQKDIASPWRELLTFYQTLYDVKIKYEQTVSQFVPAGLRDDRQLEPETEEPLELEGPLRANHVSVSDEAGEVIVDSASFAVDLPAHVAIIGPAGSGKEELTLALAGLLAPSAGRITIGECDLHRVSEPALARRLAFVGNPAYVFAGSIADNLLYSLRYRPIADPQIEAERQAEFDRNLLEAQRSGNSPYTVEADWDDFTALGIAAPEERRAALLAALDEALLANDVYEIGLRSRLPVGEDPGLPERLLEARRHMQARLADDRNLQRLVEPFDPDSYNQNATLAENLLFGTPIGGTFDPEHISRQAYVLETLRRTGLHDELRLVGLRVAQTMLELFADLPPDHEYFRQFNFIAPEDLPDYRGLVGRADPDRLGELSAADQDRLLALPFKLVVARHRLGVVSDELQAKILEARRFFRANLPDELKDAIDFFDPDRFNQASSVQDNILFGKIAYGQAQASRRIGQLIEEVVDELELRPAVTSVGLSGQVGFAGSRLSPAQRQKLALARALLKRPEIMVLYDATGPLDANDQGRLLDNLLAAFEGRTVIWALQQTEWAGRFQHVIEMERGKVVASTGQQPKAGASEKPTEAAAAE